MTVNKKKKPKMPPNLHTKKNVIQYVRVVAHEDNISISKAKKKVKRTHPGPGSLLDVRQPTKKKKVTKKKKGELQKKEVRVRAHNRTALRRV